MKNLILNELTKIRHITLIKIVFGLFLLMAALMGIFSSEEKDMFDYAYGAHFRFMRMCGTAVLFFFSPIVVSMITQEFSQGTAHNILSRGISRKKYYMVKAICLMGTSFMIYLVTICVNILTRSILYGFNPGHYAYPDYISVVFVYHMCMLIVIFAELALFMCIGYLFNRQAAAYWVCLGVVGVENFIFLRDDDKMGLALQTLVTMDNFLENHTVLTVDFLMLLTPVFVELFLCLALAYYTFQKKDIN